MSVLGGITVPEVVASGVFPLASDYGAQQILEPLVVEHVFGSANAKISQRFYLGTKARRFLFVRQNITNAERLLLRNFWETNSGGYGAFTYAVPQADGSTIDSTCCFENAPLAWTAISQVEFSISLVLVEIPPASSPYSLSSTVTRFPGGTLAPALLSQTQEIIPLIRVQPLKFGFNPMFISDRAVTIGSQFYHPRLVDWGGISQAMGSESDDATFTFGNADGVMTDIANSTDLNRARIEFSLFHVGTGIKVDLWAGDITDWQADEGDAFQVTASDGLYELNLPYPTRRISRTCWKDFNDGASCPAASAGGTNLGTPCDKGFDTAAGCAFHNMTRYFGGIIAKPQAVYTKDNSTGVHGFGRGSLTSVSLIADSIYDEVVPEIYTDIPMPVNCKIVSGRDEGDFYVAMGIVGEGPLGEFGELTRPGPPETKIQHSLDGVQWHGYPKNNFGLRRGYGHDPVQNNDPDSASDKFSLGEGGAGIQSYGIEMAAGTAFIEIRKSDEKGLQLSRLSEHQMQAIVSKGMGGWVWTSPGSRTFVTPITNPAWIVVNANLRARGLRFASAATCEQYFDVNAAISVAAVNDTNAAKLVGTGTENQFKFIGILQEAKPLRDWITEILMNSLGGYSFSFGKLRLYSKYNSSAVESFTVGNMIFGSLKYGSSKPQFNHLTGNFADAEFEFVNNAVSVYDIDQAKQVGSVASPLFLKSTMNLSGTSSKSPVARIITTRLREEVGGVTEAERFASRRVSFRTTILALNSEVGQVDSITHPRLPGGAVEFRVAEWKLNKDYSIDISGRTTTDSMYDLTVGDKPADVVADPVPNEQEFAPADWGFEVVARGDGSLYIRNLTCATNPNTVYQASFDTYAIDETDDGNTTLGADITSSQTLFAPLNTPPVPGEWILVDGEIMAVVSYNSGTGVTVLRAQLGSTAVAHSSSSGTISAIGASKADITIPAGLTLKPANLLVQITGGAGAERIASYDAGTGRTILRYPIPTLSVGNTVTSSPRIYRVQKKTFKLTFQPRFFKGATRATFEFEMKLPMAGVVAVAGTLENTRGLKSDEVVVNLTGSGYPYRLRTLDNDKLTLIHPDVASGTTLNAFEPITLPGTNCFERAYAERSNPDSTGPISQPGAISSVAPSGLTAGGTITIAGTISAEGRISITIGDGSTGVSVVVPVFTITTETTAAQVAASLRDWLNGGDEFRQYFDASSTGAVISLTDKAGIGGIVVSDVSGGVTAAVTGMNSALGVMIGRRYAASFTATGSYESELSDLSASTGPSGSAASFSLTNLPVSGDPRALTVRVWALPDGANSGTPRLIGSVANGVTSLADNVTESALGSSTAYPGAVQPTAAGAVVATAYQGGVPWLEFRIPDTASRSNVIDGLVMGAIPSGVEITADIDNAAGAHQLRIVMA